LKIGRGEKPRHFSCNKLLFILYNIIKAQKDQIMNDELDWDETEMNERRETDRKPMVLTVKLKLSKRPERETVIGTDDFTNLQIALGLCGDLASKKELDRFCSLV
jgi:hypothetical protein